MPKKRTHTFKHLQSSNSSAGATRKDGTGSNDSPTVNERLTALRLVETPEGLQKKRDLAASVNQPSVPPELRGILGVPESAPPKPKLGVRLREMRRTPGPAPPKSWLGYGTQWQSGSGVRGGKGRKEAASASDAQRNRPKKLLRFSLLVDGMLDVAAEPSGLLHMALKRLAEQWDLFDEEDFPTLVDVPLRLRLRLLSYLGYYGPSIDSTVLQALTQGDEPLTHLDLSGLAGHGALTVKKLARLFEFTTDTTQTADSIAESWDAEEVTLESVLNPSPSMTARFHTLTHLSLSHPPPTASWRDLLALSKHVPQLTNLSLAYWPRPTFTPNLAMATVSSRHSPDVRAGGTHYYSSLDDDYIEAAALLRQLSSNLLCIQWLDLEGCADWFPALSPLAVVSASDVARTTSDESWIETTHSAVAIMAQNWKNLSYIRCAQGWLPSLKGLYNVDRSLAPDFKHLLVRHADQFPEALVADEYEIEGRKGRIWLDSEQKLIAAGRRIYTIRRDCSCKPITIDFGWCRRPA
ncbi:hypothetical protein LTR15_007940 [Elasticomyces elasticus]|nr:hypothetical protein LTR15_007940 [Elasticomyces elasticus]